MPRARWSTIADEAISQLNGTIESLGRRASWNNPALVTWDDLDNSMQMEVMRRKASWDNLGMTDEEIVREIILEARREVE